MAIATSWLVCDGRRVATLEVPVLSVERFGGLLGRDGTDGALLLQPAGLVHTFGMRFSIDVAFCDGRLRVLGVITAPRNRLVRPRIRSRAVVEASAGAFRRWGVVAGSCLTVEHDRS